MSLPAPGTSISGNMPQIEVSVLMKRQNTERLLKRAREHLVDLARDPKFPRDLAADLGLSKP